MANLFSIPWRPVLQNNLVVPGAKVWFTVYPGDTPSAPYTDTTLTTHRTNPVIADGVGKVPTTVLDPAVTYRVRIYAKNATVGVSTPLEQYNPYVPGVFADAAALEPVAEAAEEAAVEAAVSRTSASLYAASALSSLTAAAALLASIASVPTAGMSLTAASRAALALLATDKAAILHEAGREGIFVFDSSDLSAKVTDDPAEGIYVPPSSDATGASGAWVRQWVGAVAPWWWGIVASSSGAAVANSAARDAMMSCLASRSYNATGLFYGLEPIQFDHRKYWFNDAWDDHYGTMSVYGTGTGLPSSIGTTFKFPAGSDGMVFQYYNTSGQTAGPGASHAFGIGSHVRGIRVEGGFTTTEGEYNGFVLRTAVVLENCQASGFEGDGYHIHAHTSGSAGTTPMGNANLFKLYNCTAQLCRRGVSNAGADVNAYTISGGSFDNNRQFGLYEPDDASLGGLVLGAHFDANGIALDTTIYTGIAPTVVSHGGNYYSPFWGQETGASTNAPKSSTATITIASPGVVSWAAHGLVAGTVVAFSTTGALPTGLVANTAYYVVNPGANDFQLAATAGGAAINTSGTQSGVHTASAGVDNAWWYYVGTGGPVATHPAWLSGTTYRAGGPALCKSVNNVTQFIGCYSEAGAQGCPQLDGGCIVFGGSMAYHTNKGTGAVVIRNDQGFLRISKPIKVDFSGSRIGPISGTAASNFMEYANTSLENSLDWKTYDSAGTLVSHDAYTASYSTYGYIIGGSVNIGFKIGANPYLGTATIAEIDVNGFKLAAGKTIKVGGTQVIGAQRTGWTASTGTASRGAFAAAAAGTASAGYVQAEAQASRDRIAALEARLIALEADARAHGLIGA